VVNGTYYSFATGSSIANIPIAYSTDFVNWQLVLDDTGDEVDALPTVGDWVNMVSFGHFLIAFSFRYETGISADEMGSQDFTQYMGTRCESTRQWQVCHVLLCHSHGGARWCAPLCWRGDC